jgi:hypothetical protein
METTSIIAIILSGICVIGVGFAGFMIFLIDIDLYFLKFNFYKHPKLLAIVDDVLKNICEEEGIKVFHKTYEEINVDTPEDKNKSVGRYIYTIDQEYQQRLNNSLKEIEELEIKWKLPFKKLCEFVGADVNSDKEDFTLPRILLCDEKLKKDGWGSYYGTFFHELGHHFAVKKISTEHDEDDANRFGGMLIKQRLPFYFQLIFDFRYKFNEKKLTGKEKFKGYVGYLKYLITKNK